MHKFLVLYEHGGDVKLCQMKDFLVSSDHFIVAFGLILSHLCLFPFLADLLAESEYPFHGTTH